MRSRTVAAAALVALGLVGPAIADVNSSAAGGALEITLPKDGDEYSALVARAAAQDKSFDFHALLFAYLKSAARKNGKADPNALKGAL